MEYQRKGPNRPQARDLPGQRTRRYGQLLLVALLLFPPPVWAANITVTGAGGTIADDGICTLREAIHAANGDAASGVTPGECAAGAGADTITLTTNVAATFDNIGTGGANALPVVTTEITLLGDGYTIDGIAGDGNMSRHFEVSPAGDLTLDSVILTGGTTTSGAALMNNGGFLTLINTTVTGNAAGPAGGGIYQTGGSTVLEGSEVSYNVAGKGGGLFIDAGTVTLANTTISFNGYKENPDPTPASISQYGGGLFVEGGEVLLENSTISTNFAEFGGGLSVSQENGIATLVNTTVAANIAVTTDSNGDYFDSIYIDTPGGPGLVFDGGDLKHETSKVLADPVTLVNSLISNFDTSPHLNCNEFVARDGNSQVNDDIPGVPSLDSCGLGVVPLTGLDPTLAANGGPTETHALECDSSAIDAAGLCGFATDQRGLPRDDGFCDSGSYEPQAGDDPGPLYPIALSLETVAGVAAGTLIEDIYSGIQPGNFGWLTWTGDPSVPVLTASLTPPGDSDTYVNPYDSEDQVVSVGDWVQGSPGVSNASDIRAMLDALIDGEMVITVPIWDAAEDQGNNANYQVAAFAQVQLVDYRLPRDNRISAIFQGFFVPGCP